MDDARLLAHYLALGREPWNLTPASAYLEYATRAWLDAAWPAGRVRALDVGIGAGGWDDALAARADPLTAIDLDREACALLAYRHRRLGRSTRVVCCDLLSDALPAAHWPVVTAIGSTVRETGDRDRAFASLARLVAPGGRLLLHGDRETIEPTWARAACAASGLRVLEIRVDATLPDLPQTFVTAAG